MLGAFVCIFMPKLISLTGLIRTRNYAFARNHNIPDIKRGLPPPRSVMLSKWTLWEKRCLSMPPTPKKRAWLWLMEIKLRNSTLRQSPSGNCLEVYT